MTPTLPRSERMEHLMASLTAAGTRPQHFGSWTVTVSLEDGEKLMATENAPVVPWASPGGTLNVREGDEVLHEGRWRTVAIIEVYDAETLWVRFENVRYYGIRQTNDIPLTDLVAVRTRTTGEGQ